MLGWSQNPQSSIAAANNRATAATAYGARGDSTREASQAVLSSFSCVAGLVASGCGGGNSIGHTTQAITFDNPGTQTVGVPLTLSATANSGLTVSFTSATPGVCTVSGTTATFGAAGTCTIDASPVRNSTYAAASQVAQNFTVNPAIGPTTTIYVAGQAISMAILCFEHCEVLAEVWQLTSGSPLPPRRLCRRPAA